jgi:hypothetical protein
MRAKCLAIIRSRLTPACLLADTALVEWGVR